MGARRPRDHADDAEPWSSSVRHESFVSGYEPGYFGASRRTAEGAPATRLSDLAAYRRGRRAGRRIRQRVDTGPGWARR